MDMATVQNNRIVFPEGASYRILVLPDFKTMTPELLEKIESLVQEGAVIIGNPPVKSPSLSGFPKCDQKVRSLAEIMWGGMETPEKETVRNYGKGKIYWGGHFSKTDTAELFPHYEAIAELLEKMGVEKDFVASGSIRYTHRTTNDRDIYFISNRTNLPVEDICTFRDGTGTPELWDPVTGEIRLLSEFKHQNGQTSIPVKLDKNQSFFIVFPKNGEAKDVQLSGEMNFPVIDAGEEIEGSWSVSFDPKWGGPEHVTFEELEDWTKRPEDGIKHYSGIATYHKTFDLQETKAPDSKTDIYIDLGEVKNLARVKLNGKDLGVIWTYPWRVRITDLVKSKGNSLEIEVANLWGNRLIGDTGLPYDGVQNDKWPEWLLEGKKRTSGRYTFTTNRYYKKDMPLQPSGLLGPVTLYSILKID